MNDKNRWTRVGVAAAAGVMAAAVAGTGVALHAQTRRAPLTELRALVTGGPELGVSIRDVTDADAKTAQLPGPSGAWVESVRDGSPAAKAGIQASDVIVSLDGERVRGVSHLQRLVRETPEGRPVEVVLQRAGRRVTVSVTPAEPETAAPRTLLAPRIQPDLLERFEFSGPSGATTGRLGVSAEALTDQLRDYFGAPHGVLVMSVQPGSVAATAGLKAGDIITSVAGTAIRSVADLQRTVTSASGDLAIDVWRDKKSLTLTASFPARERQRRTITTNPSI